MWGPEARCGAGRRATLTGPRGSDGLDDPRFWVLREALASYVSDPDDPPVRRKDTLQAAVSLVVRGGRELEILFIKRSRHPGDPWSGHVALPGGRREDSDPTLVSTAIRETREETGVDLSSALHLGQLVDVRPSSPQLPRLTIQPHVFGVGADTPARVASPEVDAVHWVALDELRRPETEGTVEISLPGGSRAFPCFRLKGEVVWGLTYRIVSDFLDRYPEAELRGSG